jgi:hypothetical protein
MLRAQVQAISLVLITGIVMSLAGAAYFWGRPLIEKRSAITDIATAESFIMQLNDEIMDVARNRGEKTLNIPALPASQLILNESGNALVFQFVSGQPMLSVGGESIPIPIDTEHIEPVGTYGESPRIITLESKAYETQYLMTLKLIYRELYVESIPRKGYKIDLETFGKTGNSKVSVSYKGTETVIGAGGAEVLQTLIDVKIS